MPIPFLAQILPMVLSMAASGMSGSGGQSVAAGKEDEKKKSFFSLPQKAAAQPRQMPGAGRNTNYSDIIQQALSRSRRF